MDAVGIYSSLVKLYPKSFQDRYADEMEMLFEELYLNASTGPEKASLLLNAFWDTFKGVFRENISPGKTVQKSKDPLFLSPRFLGGFASFLKSVVAIILLNYTHYRWLSGVDQISAAIFLDKSSSLAFFTILFLLLSTVAILLHDIPRKKAAWLVTPTLIISLLTWLTITSTFIVSYGSQNSYQDDAIYRISDAWFMLVPAVFAIIAAISAFMVLIIVIEFMICRTNKNVRRLKDFLKNNYRYFLMCVVFLAIMFIPAEILSHYENNYFYTSGIIVDSEHRAIDVVMNMLIAMSALSLLHFAMKNKFIDIKSFSLITLVMLTTMTAGQIDSYQKDCKDFGHTVTELELYLANPYITDDQYYVNTGADNESERSEFDITDYNQGQQVLLGQLQAEYDRTCGANFLISR